MKNPQTRWCYASLARLRFVLFHLRQFSFAHIVHFTNLFRSGRKSMSSFCLQKLELFALQTAQTYFVLVEWGYGVCAPSSKSLPTNALFISYITQFRHSLSLDANKARNNV